MEVSKTTSSFIPRQTPISVGKAYKAENSVGFFMVICVMIFLVVLGSAVGVFIWKKMLEKNIAGMDEKLRKNRAEFEPALIQELTRLNTRIVTAKALIESHIAPSRVFELFEEYTLKGIRFTDFSYKYDPKRIGISMSGQAQSFNAVAFQSDTFAKIKHIQNPIFSDLDLDQNGNVIFEFNTAIANPYLMFKSKMGAENKATTNQ